MFFMLGLAVVFGSVIGGYLMHHGDLAVLMQVNEFVIIGGCGLGAIVIGNTPSTVKRIFTDTLALLRPNPYDRAAFTELLQVLYEVFYSARKDGLVGIESHVENPYDSPIFKKYPRFYKNRHAVAFLSDTLKVLLTGAVDDHHLSEILDMDLEQHRHEALKVPNALRTVGDAMPGFGIVAAVLGIINTMKAIGGSPEVVGKSVAAALVGTFLGVLLAYGFFAPIANATQARVVSEERYLAAIRTAILSFSRGDPPITSVEFARRNIESETRPSFAELERLIRRSGRTES